VEVRFNESASQKRFAIVKQLLLRFCQEAFPFACAAAEDTKGVKLQKSLAEFKALTSEEVTTWLDAIGWTIESVSAFIVIMMSILGVLSGCTDIIVQYSSKLFNVA